MNEVVKYENYMNSLRFKGFTAVDFNFLMMLCSKMRDKRTNILEFTFTELKRITDYPTKNSTKRFVSDILRMNDKLMSMKCLLKKDDEIFQFVLFPTFSLNEKKEILTVSVNERFMFILNDITRNFTRFELEQFVKIESKHAKNLYRLLKQYRTTGILEIVLNDFREKMDCPESYTNKHVMDKIIKPSIKELREKKYFHNLQCTTKYAHKRGKPVIGYKFTFTPESRVIEADQSQNKMNKSNQNQQQKQNSFANFHQRTYDYDQLERELINREKSDAEKLDNESIELQIKNILDEMRK